MLHQQADAVLICDRPAQQFCQALKCGACGAALPDQPAEPVLVGRRTPCIHVGKAGSSAMCSKLQSVNLPGSLEERQLQVKLTRKRVGMNHSPVVFASGKVTAKHHWIYKGEFAWQSCQAPCHVVCASSEITCLASHLVLRHAISWPGHRLCSLRPLRSQDGVAECACQRFQDIAITKPVASHIALVQFAPQHPS